MLNQHTVENKGHRMDYNNIKVIDSTSNDFKLRMKELLHILKSTPELNKQLNSQSDFDIKKIDNQTIQPSLKVRL